MLRFKCKWTDERGKEHNTFGDCNKIIIIIKNIITENQQ